MAERWLTAQQIADLALPGLPATKSAVIRRADREGWDFRSRQGRGGGREYATEALPIEARRELARRELLAERPAVPAPATPALPTHRLRDWQRRCMEARAALLAEVDRLALVSGGLGEARRLVEEASASGTLPPALQGLVEAANNRKGNRDGVSAVTLKRWHALRERQGVAGLAPKGGAPEEVPVPAWLPDFLELYQRPGKPSISASYDRLLAERPDVALPPLRTVQRQVMRITALEREKGRMGPRARRALKAYTRRDASELWPGAVYVLDGHTHDAMVAHPHHGRPFRPELTAVIDVYTRRIVGWSAALAEATWGTLDAFRHAFERSAICDVVYVDNGSGFNSEAFDAVGTGFFARWGATKKNSLPYHSEARGIVERVHQSLWIKGARFLPAFVGADMDPEARKRVDARVKADIEERGASPLLQEWGEFLAWAQSQVDAYNARPHSSLERVRDTAGRLRHVSPDEAWRRAIEKGWQPETVDGLEAPDLFRPWLQRSILKGGWIRLGNKHYFHRDLLWPVERDVIVAYDIHDPSRIWVRDLDHRLLCIAELDGNTTSYFPLSEVERAREKREAARLRRAEDRVEKIRAESAPAIEHHQVIPLPIIDDAERDAVAERIQAPPPALAPIDEALARFARARGLELRLGSGVAVDAADTAWLKQYQASREYQSYARLEEQFGQPLVEPAAR